MMALKLGAFFISLSVCLHYDGVQNLQVSLQLFGLQAHFPIIWELVFLSRRLRLWVLIQTPGGPNADKFNLSAVQKDIKDKKGKREKKTKGLLASGAK